MNNHLKFTAKNTSYSEALDGDIIQVIFEEDENEDPYNQTKLYLSITINHEFPSFTPSIEWFDGNDGNGGAQILNYKLKRNSLQLLLNNNLSFNISFIADERLFQNIKGFLSSVTQNIKNA